MDVSNSHYLVPVRPAFQLGGWLLGVCGVLALAMALLKYERMVSLYGMNVLMILLGTITLFSAFIITCSALGRLPYWLAKRLPDDLLHSIKDHRNITTSRSI